MNVEKKAQNREQFYCEDPCQKKRSSADRVFSLPSSQIRELRVAYSESYLLLVDTLKGSYLLHIDSSGQTIRKYEYE